MWSERKNSLPGQFFWFTTFTLLTCQSFANAKRSYYRDPGICGLPTCTGKHKFGFTPGVKYEYSYNIKIDTTFDGAGNITSDINMHVLFNLQFRTKCEGVLQITDAWIINGTNERNHSANLFKTSLSQNRLRFHFENGIIPQICPTPDEPVWVLNLKKGILSSFQNSMDRFDVDQFSTERDINGDCISGYFFKQVNNTEIIIDKIKELASCTNRYHFYSLIPTTPYIFQKRYHKWTPLNSAVVCQQHIDHNIYEKIVCREMHAYQPFYNQTNGAITTSEQEIILISQNRSSYSDKHEINSLGLIEQRDSLLFDHRRPKYPTHDDLYECEQLLTSLCFLAVGSIKPQFPDVLNRFIHIARHLTTPALANLYKKSDIICPTGKKYFLEALPYIRSRASTSVMTDVILSKEISSSTMQEWLLVMSFIPRPDAETVDSVSQLLFTGDFDAQTMLAVSTVLHSFCENNNNCQESSTAIKIINTLENMFNSTCINNQNIDRAYSSLKALGNAGVPTHTLIKSLQTCILNEALPVSLRIEAINVHRRLPCELNEQFLSEIYSNQDNDQEIRIAAYLQIMKCPSYSILEVVKTTLNNETFNQVGSFVFSHLQTQLKSVMPRKVIIQAILQDVEWDNKFDKDFRKFSRNFEHSFYLNSFGVGGFVETNVIFSQQSYIPRSVTFNVTVDLFGESINLFEISLYMENLEKYVEKWSKKWKMIIEDNINTIFNHLRVVRSVQYPLKELLDSVAFKKVMKEVKVSISLKLFGNEIKYYRINTDEDFQEILEFINPMKIIANFLSGKEIKHERSVMFLDMSYTTPMNAGVPLKINAVGTAAVNVNAMGFINSSKLREDSELEIDGKLKPTIGINFEGSMVVDNFILNTGVKFKGRLFTSTAVEGSIKAESYKFLSISFNLPMKKSVIISVETELILLNGHNEVSIEGITAGRVENRLCTWSILDEVIGLKFCTNSLLPNATLLLKSPLFIFSGPLKFTITLEKSDPTAEKYIIQYKWDTVANKTKISFHFETPGSISKRGMKAVVDLDTQSQNLTLIYESPRSQVQAQGFYQNSPSQKSINFGLNINGKKHIDIKVGMDIEREKYGNSYTPKILLAINDKRIAELSGTIRWVEKKGVAQGDIDLDFKTNKFTTVIAGYVRKTNFSVSTNIKMNYKFGSGTEETVRVELKLGDRSSKYLTQLFGNLQIESTAYPQINLITSLKYQKAQDHTECKIDSYTNPYIDDDNKKLHVQWEYRFLNSYMLGSKMNTSLLITKPSSNIDISIGLVHHDHSSDSTSRTTLITKYATGKEMKVNLFLKLPHGSHFYFQSTIIISLPVTTQDMSIFTKIYEKEQSYREYDIDFEGRWFSGHNFTIKGVYQDLSTLLLTSHSVKLRARSELFKDVYLYGQVKMSEDEYGTDLRADHDNIDYRVVLWHYSKAQGMYETYGEVKYNKSLYSVTNNIDLAYRQTTLDLHLDKFRDIQVSIRGLSNKTMIDAGLDVKWDANRDPSQKVVVIIATNSYGNMHCDGKAILEYPGRIIKSLFLTQHKGTDYILSASAEWSPKNKVIIFFQGTYDIPDHGYARFNSRLSTPFPKWEYSALDYELKVEEKGIQSNGCLSWINNKKITFGLAGNYMYTENDIYFNFASSLNSTIPGINSMYAIFKHKRIGQKYDTVIALQSNPNQVISITSSGLIFSSSEVIKYIFNLGISSPFVIITKASAELYIYPNQRFRGSVQMNENGKKYITVIEGSVKTWNESKINFHISTPIEKYKLIHAKFGFSASKKHLIAEIKAPTSAVGVEIIYIYNNISDFDLKFHVHTSIMFINSLLLVGKINYEIVDLRCGWNVLLVGLTGSSHYESWKDVDYRLQIFTPIEGYHTSSVIAKFIYDEKIDFEFSLNFAAKKFGIMVQAMHKPDDDFALPVKPMLKNESMLGSLPYYPLEFEEPEYGNIFWRGVLKLDSLFYPSVTAYIQINDDEEVEYSIVSFFDFPFGQLKLKDNLEYIDLLNIKNKLNITTTCECLMEISGTFVISGTMNRNVVSKIEIIKISYNETTQGSSDVSYSFTPLEEGSMFEGRHSLYFKAKTPFLVLSNCDFYLNLNLKKQVYEADVSAIINKSVFILNGTLKTDENYLDSNLATRVNTPHFVLPMCQIKLRKDFTDIEKKLSIGLALPNEKGDGLVNYGAAVLWHSDGPNYMKYLLQILTPYKNIGAIKGSVEYKMDPEGDEYFLESFIKYSETSDVRVRGIIQKNRLIFKIESSFQSFRNIEINTTIKSIGNVRTLDTELTTNKEHRIQGWASLTPDRPLMIEMKLLKSATKAEILSVHIIITKNILGYEVNSLVQYNGQSININGNYVLLEKLGNKLNLLITSTYPGYKELQLNTLLLTTNSKAIVSHVSGATSSKWINTTIDLSFNASLTEIGGVIHTSVISPIFRSNIRLIWLWELLEHMLCSISGDYSYSEIKSDIFLRLYYWNIENKKMSVGIDVNYNQLEWLLSTNATLIIPSWNDFLFGSYMLLPQKREELHTVLAKLRYAKNFTYFSHLLEYLPHSNKSALQTLSEISITKTLSKGTMLLEAGRHRLFDKFHALPDNNGYKIDNFLQSTNMDEDLYFTLHYKKPESNQLFLLDVFYPPSVPIISSYIEFSALNNMLARMNCTVPFKSIPSTTVMLKIVTSPTFYQRYGQVFWNNNTAIFNYTHSSQFQINKNMTDGSIVIEFPLVTRHKGNLNYFYESSEMFANGHSKLEYNDEIIMSGNYSRSTKLTVLNKHEIINMNVNNSYVPVWITYIKQFNKHNKNNKYPFTVLKRVEIFQMDPGPSFNITGEMSTYETSTDKLVSLKAIHGHRSLTVHTFRKGLTKFSTMANFTLKPNVWAGYGIKLIKKRDFMGQRLELNITYPRRLLKINGEYDWTENQLNTKISIFPNENKRANPIAADLHWKQVSISPQCHEASVMIFHPSFKKNISLSGIYRQNLNTPINIDINLEYSTDNKKRLMLGTIIENKSDKSARYYEISAVGRHPATRLNLSFTGLFKLYESLLEVHKNISYTESNFENNFWNFRVKVDKIRKSIEIERESLRDSGYILARYGNKNPVYTANVTFANGSDLNISGDFSIDIKNYVTQLLINFTPDATEQFHMLGECKDNRQGFIDLWRTYDGIKISDLSIFSVLNHSRMASSTIKWRPNVRKDIMILIQNSSEYIWSYTTQTANFLTEKVKSKTIDSILNIWYDAKPILQNFIDDIRDTKNLQEDIEQFKVLYNESYYANEFYMRDIYHIYLVIAEEISFSGHVPRIFNEIWDILGGTGESIRQSILWIVESMKNLYEKFQRFLKSVMSGDTLNQLTQNLQEIAGKYDKLIKDTHIMFLHYVEYLWAETSHRIYSYWSKFLKAIEPTYYEIINYIDTVIVGGAKNLIDFIFQKQSQFLSSTFFRTNSHIRREFDQFFHDITKNGVWANAKKYSKMLMDLITDKYFELVPFGYELNEISTEIIVEIKELYTLPFINFTIETTKELNSQVIWVYNYLKIGDKLSRIIPILYTTAVDLSHTALENEIINHEGRTKFIFDPENGLIKLEQKLPVPWHAFNETPNFEEIPEYKTIKNLQKLLAPSNKTFWTYYYSYIPLLDPLNWLPPFKAQAFISGGQHFITFDGKHFEFKTPCTYLLAKDFVDETFTLVFKYEHNTHNIVLIVGQHVITVDMLSDALILGEDHMNTLPLQLGELYLYREEGIIFINSNKRFSLKCNVKFGVCTFTLSGWYFGKTAGLLGTMDNEPANDFLTSTGIIETNIDNFITSWALGLCTLTDVTNKKQLNTKHFETCSGLFLGKTSTFSPCFSLVDPHPFNALCQRNLPGINNEVCTAAFSYIKACGSEHLPLRMPNLCTSCSLPDGTLLEEGNTHKIGGKDVPMSTDVIFIVEAKHCTKYWKEKKTLQIFMSVLGKELKNVGLINNRYGVVTFGGNGVFEHPRSIYVNNQFFTSEKNVPYIFERIPAGDGKSDIFGALRYASTLPFRPGVAKTFILFPCSTCHPANMTVEYSVISHVLMENDITLHILMNVDFHVEKQRSNKLILGLDSENAYTKHDLKQLKGDRDLRRQIKLTKDMLGYCTPLAIETNGTIFTGKKLHDESMSVKKFSSIFAKRIAVTAEPDSCQLCECIANSDGMQYIECLLCEYTVPEFLDFDNDDNYTIFQTLETPGD